MRRAIRTIIEGRVQGVGYRAFVEREALARGIAGWVRNRRNGAVEALFVAESSDIDAMLAACRAGPCLAKIEAIDIAEVTDPPRFGGFSILPTA